MSYFKSIKANIYKNDKLREPQIDSHLELKNYFDNDDSNDSALVVLPTGVGKTTLIAIAPFYISDGRVLIIAPQLTIRNGILNSLRPNNPENVYYKYNILPEGAPYPKIFNYNSSYSKEIKKELLDDSDIVILNVHKLQDRLESSLINLVPCDYFDMIIIDEAHHAEANTWKATINYFNKAKVVKVTATPFRTDNVIPEGKLVYNYKLSEAMVNDYVKSLQKIDYISQELQLTIDDIDDKKYSVDKLYELGIKDEDWVSRSVAFSPECNKKIAETSIELLNKLRAESDIPHKIIAVACSIKHAESIASIYESFGLKVGIIHSYLDDDIKNRFFERLEQNLFDVLINVNMLGEGFDHKYLTIGAIFKPFRSLLPYQQFVGRLLRRIPKEECSIPEDNVARVVSHHYLYLDKLWEEYQKSIDEAEVIRGLHNVIKLSDYTTSDREPSPSDVGKVYESGNGTLSQHDFLSTDLIKEAKERSKIRNERIRAAAEALDIDFATAEKMYEATNKSSEMTLDEMFETTQKRLYKQIQYEIPISICNELNIDPKGNELLKSPLIEGKTKYIVSNGNINNNDAIIAIYLNCYFRDSIGYKRNNWSTKLYKVAIDKLEDRKNFIIDLLKRN